MKVGNYVRTKYGVIAKITDILENCSIDCDRDIYYENDLKDYMPMMEIPYDIKDEYIIKSSSNIIDLIEVGDYVNGIYVNIIEKEQKRVGYASYYGDEDMFFYNEDIKSIVTKEQFESMQYEVE